MSSSFFPARGRSPYFGNPVATVIALPASGTTGEIRLVLSTDELYEWDGSAWITVKTAASSITGVLPIANGGTNSGVALANNRIMRSTAGAVVEAAAITAARALISDGSGIPTHSAVTSTELGYVAGVTSAIQTQIDGKQPLDADLTALAALATTGLIARTGAGTVATRTVTAGVGISVADGDGVAGNPTITSTITQYTDEMAQDAVGNILTDSSKIDFTYNDGAPSITATIVADSLVNADINTAAAIARSKLAAGTANRLAYNLAVTGVLSDLPAITASRALESDANGLPVASATTAAELAFVSGVTSAIQTQLNAKQPLDAELTAIAALGTGIVAITGAGTAAARTITASTGITVSNGSGAAGNPTISITALTASRAVVTDGSGNLAVATTTAAEIGFVNGVTSAIQTQLDARLCASSITSVSSNVTLTNKSIHLVDTTAARSLTLPAPAASSFIVVKDSTGNCTTNNITIVRAAAEKIETVAASYVLNNDLGSWTFVSNGTDWFIV